MSQLDLTAAAAAEHVRDLRATAAQGRLAALVRCCAPLWERAAGRIASTARGAAAWLRRDHLGPVQNYCGGSC